LIDHKIRVELDIILSDFNIYYHPLEINLFPKLNTIDPLTAKINTSIESVTNALIYLIL